MPIFIAAYWSSWSGRLHRQELQGWILGYSMTCRASARRKNSSVSLGEDELLSRVAN